ncbi:MAG: ABC transporter ATP-binding protein [Candidatus Thorarchaeota archaeon]|nr:MAG: ABC transporter ATP-binding protein [Candidatus Thorarchaeota archaeon]
MVRVNLQSLIREFPDGTRVGPIDLEINDGELMTLLGPSGSGKTTTLRMIAGFIRVDKGSVLFDGEDVVGVHPRDRRIGMVFQSIALFPNMTVYQNIAFGPEMAGWSREKTVERVEELADLLGIRHLLLRRIREISGGEGQRVALARALAKRPDLLLLDEPLSALDPQLREKLQTEIRRIQKHLGITTLYVTHSQDEAFAISDRVAVLEDGRIAQVGTPEELYDRPKSEFVARFLGSGNVFVGKVVSNNGNRSTVEVAGEQFVISGHHDIGAMVSFSVKPEDITILEEVHEDHTQARVTSITPQVGSFKVRLQIDGQTVLALTYDENLIRHLREHPNRVVSFSFRPEHSVILSS